MALLTIVAPRNSIQRKKKKKPRFPSPFSGCGGFLRAVGQREPRPLSLASRARPRTRSPGAAPRHAHHSRHPRHSHHPRHPRHPWSHARAAGCARCSYSLLSGSEVCHISPLSTSSNRTRRSTACKAVSRTVSKIQEEGEERGRRGKGAGVGELSPEDAVSGSQPRCHCPQPSSFVSRSSTRCTCSLFLHQGRSQCCNICVPCWRQNSDFLQRAVSRVCQF